MEDNKLYLFSYYHMSGPPIWKIHLCGNTTFPNVHYISLPSIAATFLTTHLTAVIQPSRYSVFHDRNTLI